MSERRSRGTGSLCSGHPLRVRLTAWRAESQCAGGVSAAVRTTNDPPGRPLSPSTTSSPLAPHSSPPRDGAGSRRCGEVGEDASRAPRFVHDHARSFVWPAIIDARSVASPFALSLPPSAPTRPHHRPLLRLSASAAPQFPAPMSRSIRGI
ncbi:hypothetical protein BJY59DRAFT_686317 [Rhodotorula toruloides]